MQARFGQLFRLHRTTKSPTVQAPSLLIFASSVARRTQIKWLRLRFGFTRAAFRLRSRFSDISTMKPSASYWKERHIPPPSSHFLSFAKSNKIKLYFFSLSYAVRYINFTFVDVDVRHVIYSAQRLDHRFCATQSSYETLRNKSMNVY